MLKPESVMGNETHKILCDFEMQTDHRIPARKPDLILIIKKKKRTCHLVNFALRENHRVKIKESEKIDKYLDLAGERKKLWNITETVITAVVGSLGTIPKGLEKRLEELEIRERIRPSRLELQNSPTASLQKK